MKKLTKFKFKFKHLSNISFGSDPETMIFNRKLNKIVSAIPVLKNDKNNPIKLESCKIYADNTLLEAAFAPSQTKEEFVNTFRNVFKNIKNYLGEDFELKPQAAHVYDATELQDRQAWEIGCSPNYDAYRESANEMNGFTDGLRTASCHIHLGNEKLKDCATRIAAIKLLDVFLGCGSVIFDKDPSSLDRRRYYGRAGEFRPTTYGLEYRPLSPYVLNSPKLIELVYDLIQHSMGYIGGGQHNQFLQTIDLEEVKKSINTCDKELANKVLIQANTPVELINRIQEENEINFEEAWK